MKVVKPSAKILNYEDPYKLIERVGRICYKSEDKIAEGSAEKFVRGLMKRSHYAMIEHSNIILKVTDNFYKTLKQEFDTTFLRMTEVPEINAYIVSGSFRAFRDMFLKKGADITFLACKLYHKYPLMFEDVVKDIYEEVPLEHEVYEFSHCYEISEDWLKDLYKDHPEQLMEHIAHTLHFVCDRGVTHELVRHRTASFAQESTRYVNYSKDGEITVILPLFFDTGMGANSNSIVYSEWKHSCEVAERTYLKLLEHGATPQEARTVLPNSLKTEIVVTATETEWQHIIDLRYLGTTGAPHPQMKELIGLAINELIKESRTILYEK